MRDTWGMKLGDIYTLPPASGDTSRCFTDFRGRIRHFHPVFKAILERAGPRWHIPDTSLYQIINIPANLSDSFPMDRFRHTIYFNDESDSKRLCRVLDFLDNEGWPLLDGMEGDEVKLYLGYGVCRRKCFRLFIKYQRLEENEVSFGAEGISQLTQSTMFKPYRLLVQI